MGWAIGFDSKWNRDVGFGVPAYCDHPKCDRVIDRGLGYVCGGDVYGGEYGCGLFFCGHHLLMGVHAYVCKRCYTYKPPYKRIKVDHPTWVTWKLTDASWEQWRNEHPQEVDRMRRQIKGA